MRRRQARNGFPDGRRGEASGEVLGFQFREVFENLFLGHATGKVFENVFHRDTHSPDAGLAAAHVRVKGDAIMKIHGRKLALVGWERKEISEGGQGICIWKN